MFQNISADRLETLLDWGQGFYPGGCAGAGGIQGGTSGGSCEPA